MQGRFGWERAQTEARYGSAVQAIIWLHIRDSSQPEADRQANFEAGWRWQVSNLIKAPFVVTFTTTAPDGDDLLERRKGTSLVDSTSSTTLQCHVSLRRTDHRMSSGDDACDGPVHTMAHTMNRPSYNMDDE